MLFIWVTPWIYLSSNGVRRINFEFDSIVRWWQPWGFGWPSSRVVQTNVSTERWPVARRRSTGEAVGYVMVGLQVGLKTTLQTKLIGGAWEKGKMIHAISIFHFVGNENVSALRSYSDSQRSSRIHHVESKWKKITVCPAASGRETE